MKLWHLFLSIQLTNKFLLLAAMADEMSDLKEGNGGEALEGNVYEEVSIMVARLLIRWLQNVGKEIYKCNKYILHEMRQQRKTFSYIA